MIRLFLAAALALLMGANGLVMLTAGRWWYAAVPGVTETGPFNPHFVKDIGAAYLVVGLAFGWLAFVWLAARPSALARGAACAATAFLGFHGLIHMVEAIGDPAGLADLTRDFPAVILPALLALFLVLTPYAAKEPRRAQSLA